MILETVCVGAWEVNCYILASDSGCEAIIIDPGDSEEKIRGVLNKYRLKPALIINTHGHIDHIGCDDEFGVPVYIHSRDKALLTDPQRNLSLFLSSAYCVDSRVKTLEDKDKVEAGGILLEVIHTPGHTPGGICLLMKKPQDNILFTGDSLFCQGIGRTDFPEASEALLIQSIKDKLFKLRDNTVIYPGHGPSSTIGRERKTNPFLISA